jgi:hypothetical protein
MKLSFCYSEGTASLVLAVLLNACSAVAAPAEMPAALQASGPNASLGDATVVIGRLIGSWTVDYRDIAKDGKVTHRTGRFSVGWVLDGLAVQDVWVVDPSGARKEREVYTDLFYYDPKAHAWHDTFVDPEHSSVAKFIGAVEGDKLVLHTPDLGAADSRWTYADIGPNSFVYRDEASNDGGKTWLLRSEYRMTRELPGAL